MSREISGLKESVVQSYVHMNATLYWMPMIYRYSQKGFSSIGDLQETVDELLSVVIEGRFELFGFSDRELWNFALYIFNEDTHLLVPVWRRKHGRLPSEGLGRTWAIGTGHVGKAFADNEAKITENAIHETIFDHMRAPLTLRRDYDEVVYRSFSAIPIQIGNEGERPLGILVGTSNQAGRFTKDNSLILYHAANALAMLMQMNDTPVWRILHNAQEATEVGGGQ